MEPSNDQPLYFKIIIKICPVLAFVFSGGFIYYAWTSLPIHHPMEKGFLELVKELPPLQKLSPEDQHKLNDSLVYSLQSIERCSGEMEVLQREKKAAVLQLASQLEDHPIIQKLPPEDQQAIRDFFQK